MFLDFTTVLGIHKNQSRDTEIIYLLKGYMHYLYTWKPVWNMARFRAFRCEFRNSTFTFTYPVVWWTGGAPQMTWQPVPSIPLAYQPSYLQTLQICYLVYKPARHLRSAEGNSDVVTKPLNKAGVNAAVTARNDLSTTVTSNTTYIFQDRINTSFVYYDLH